METKPFVPYWLLHEPDKRIGFATLDLKLAATPEKAIEVWRDQVREDWKGIVDWDAQEIAARLITEPFIT